MWPLDGLGLFAQGQQKDYQQMNANKFLFLICVHLRIVVLFTLQPTLTDAAVTAVAPQPA